jgi:hypothetical protein
MGWLFGSNSEEVDQDVIDQADTHTLKILAIQAGLSFDEYITEINKQIAIKKGAELLEDLSTRHKVISLNSGASSYHIIPEDYKSIRTTQYNVSKHTV